MEASKKPESPEAAAPPRTRLEDVRSIGDATASWPAARAHLIVGPVGAGKSTYGMALAREHGGVRLTLDEWMTELFSKDRPDTGVIEWYRERAARCVGRIWSVGRDVLDAGCAVILEIGLLQRAQREAFYERVAATSVAGSGVAIAIHVIDASRDVRRARVERRNRERGETFSMIVPAPIFELASDMWEPPDASECEGRDVRFVRTDTESGV
jgi:predicted kinase